MYWNYRVLKTQSVEGTTLAIHEVYYDSNDQPQFYSEDPAPCMGDDTLEALGAEIERFRGALLKPVLTPEDFKGSSFEECAFNEK